LPGPVLEIIEALRILSYHVSSIGLDPELVRIDPTLEEHESPFMAQNAELVAYLANYRSAWNDPEVAVEDERHLVVMLDQCEDVVLRIRRKAAKIGTSLSLTFKLERLHQHLTRIAALLELLIQIRSDHRIVSVAPLATRLFIELTTAECRKNALSDYWGKNLELLSLRMTESASRSGEHYITSTRSEYFGIMRSAALGGLIIALMASLKIVLDWQGFAPLNEALMFCLNYGIGFALIHILGGTVATKQPAMTANAIAASIGETRGRNRDLGSLADLIVRTIRSQIAAIIGNIGVAIPMAMLVSIAVHLLSGEPFLAPDDARYLLDEVNPLGATLIFAAMAGVCLFLSGLIAGYYDNLCAYGRIPQRLLQLRWPRRMLGERPVQRIADYVENNLGALAGNFFFGFLLGGVTALGTLFGLPLDIRHIAFSSAYVGHAIVGLDFSLPWRIGLLAAGGIVLIGVVNLAVSFSLSLAVAMRARRITFDQGKDLVALVLTRLRARPMDLFRAPPDLP
jgi:site-specific recombinase